MAHRDIVVVGASAGGVEALQRLVAGLSPALPAAIFVVVHMPPYQRSELADILAKATALPVVAAKDGAPIVHGKVYVAVPDRHLLFDSDRLRVTRGPKENRTRPAVDVLFRSAAFAFGPRVIGIVLSGALDDGTAGLWAIKDRGGIAMVQSPSEAVFSSMPESALQHVAVDAVLPVLAMPEAIATFVEESLPEMELQASPRMEIETRIAMNENALGDGDVQLGPLSRYTCPQCNGTLAKLTDQSIVRYRCHVGHAYSQRTLLEQVNEQIDMAFSQVLRAIEDRARLLRDFKGEATAPDAADRYAKLIAEDEGLAQQVRALLSKQ